jgi:hypothetical protein
LLASAATARYALADDCPKSNSPIQPDRPGFTNTPIVVPYGSLEAENGVTWTNDDQSDILDGPETLLRLGVAHCVELVIMTPSYFFAMNGPASSGYSDVVPSFKWQLPPLFGIDTAAAGGIAFPSGSENLSGGGYDPYVQGMWSRDISDNWNLSGMFTLSWLTSRSSQNPTFAPSVEIARGNLLPAVGAFLEYAGEYPAHLQPSQIIDSGLTWQIARLQQVDLNFGFGLNRSSPNHFLGFGYSFRLDHLF